MGYINESALGVGAGSPIATTLTLSTNATNDIIVEIAQSGTGIRTYTVSDNIHGGYGAAVVSHNPSNRGVHVFRKKAGLGGALTITVTASSGTAGFVAIAYQVSNLDQLATPITSVLTGPSVNAHDCADAAAGHLDTVIPAFICTASALSGSFGGEVKSQFFDASAASSPSFFQRLDSLVPVTNLLGTWNHTGTARASTSCMVAFPYNSGPPPIQLPRVRTRGFNGKLN